MLLLHRHASTLSSVVVPAIACGRPLGPLLQQVDAQRRYITGGPLRELSVGATEAAHVIDDLPAARRSCDASAAAAARHSPARQRGEDNHYSEATRQGEAPAVTALRPGGSSPRRWARRLAPLPRQNAAAPLGQTTTGWRRWLFTRVRAWLQRGMGGILTSSLPEEYLSESFSSSYRIIRNCKQVSVTPLDTEWTTLTSS